MHKFLFVAGSLCALPVFAQNPYYFVPVPPCRVADTRGPTGPTGGPMMSAGTSREFPIRSVPCGIPTAALGFSLNVTAVPRGPLGYLTVWQPDTTQPQTSVLNSLDGRVKANAVMISGSAAEGTVSIFASNDTDVVLDVNGYFVPEGTPGSCAFFPVAPCRAADTRDPVGVLGGPSLAAGQSRLFPINSSGCGAPSSAAAYVLNVTAVPHGPLGYVTLWPNNGQSAPIVSALNAPTGQTTANLAVVPPGSDGQINAIASNDTDLVIDVVGYFAAPAPGGLAMVTQAPCRAFDSRQSPGTPLAGQSTTEIPILGAACGVPSGAQGVWVNATAVPPGPLGYLTMFGDTGGGEPGVPSVSTLNALDGQVTSNLAILPTSPGQADDAFVSNTTHLVVDVYGYLALP